MSHGVRANHLLRTPSGYLLIVPEARARPLEISVDDAFKFVVSAGAVLPSGAPPQPGLDLKKLLREPS